MCELTFHAIRSHSGLLSPPSAPLLLAMSPSLPRPRKYSFVAHGPCTVNVLKKSELKKCFATWPVAEATVLTAVLNKYNYEAKRDYTVLPHKDLIDKVAITLDEMSGPALVVAKEDKRHAVLEVRRRLTSVS